MKNKKLKSKKGAFHKSLEVMTNHRLMNAIVLDSDNKVQGVRLLQDPSTGLYLVFIGKYNQTFFSRSYQAAERQFYKCIELNK